ncbi:MAG TPA: glycosyl hydrolase [Actinocrinis sp.]|nr:glycosyl hydrolase [Actinocrinis sp.]
MLFAVLLVVLFADTVAPLTAPLLLLPAHAADKVPFGAFLGSETDGTSQVADFDDWLLGLPAGTPAPAGAPRMTVGHTYLAGDNWSDVEGDPAILGPWTQWHQESPGSLLVLNVPMLVPNEQPTDDATVAGLLRQGAAGDFDAHFATLARRLVAAGAGDTILLPGWEMNGTTYTGRCGPDPADWKTYWQAIVTTMRAVPGQHFRFDFDPARGLQAVPWADCYPGDAYVDIIGMDSYDQAPGRSFEDYVNQPDGLAAQVAFAAAHGKPVSYPEWGLFDYGDDPAFVTDMLGWVATHHVVYQTLTDYCPHGFFACDQNPRSGAAYRAALG